MSNILRSQTLSVMVALALLTSGGCGGKRPPSVTPGTVPVGLPPLPSDIATQVYQADAYLSRNCANVPSGLRNCQAWLRENASARLLDNLEHETTDQLASKDGHSIEGGQEANNGFSESSSIDRSIAREAIVNLRLLPIESPILALDDGLHYAMRVLVVRQDADYRILTAMAERAEQGGRKTVADRYRTELRQRFGESGLMPRRARTSRDASRTTTVSCGR